MPAVTGKTSSEDGTGIDFFAAAAIAPTAAIAHSPARQTIPNATLLITMAVSWWKDRQGL
jgi:hypothetical protein